MKKQNLSQVSLRCSIKREARMFELEMHLNTKWIFIKETIIIFVN